jgi:SAM-dependent methyltransferase
MAVQGDFVFLASLLAEARIAGDVLDIGSLNHQRTDEGNTRVACERAGLNWEGADFQDGPDVSFSLDILDRTAVEKLDRRWDSVLLFNLLEHVYDPIRALENALALVKPGGVCVVVAPSVWEIHDYPRDFWRLLPDFYIEFARKNDCAVDLTWIAADKTFPIEAMKDGEQKLLPSKRWAHLLYGSRKAGWSRLVHRTFNTLGRGALFFPTSGIGAVLQLRRGTSSLEP